MGGNTYQHEDVLKRAVEALSHEQGLENMCHMRWQGEPLPSQSMIMQIIELSRSVLFPGFFGDEGVNSYKIGRAHV